MKYRIDNSDTIRVITGGGIEKTLIPLFYLALENLAREHILSDHELHEAGTTILSIANAAFDRVNGLRNLFEQQNLHPKDQFKIFSAGLYNLYNEHNLLSWDKLRELSDPIRFGDEIIPNLDSTPLDLSILNHPLDERHEIHFDPLDVEHLPTKGNVCLVYNGARDITFTLSKGAGERELVADSNGYIHGEHKEEKFTGHWDPPSENGKITIGLKVTEDTMGPAVIELKGSFEPEENSLRGVVVLSSGEGIGEFVFKRDADFVRFYPAPSEVNAHTRWEFAMRSVLHRVGREAWSERILKRIETGKRFMELKFHCGMGTQDDDKAYHDLSFGFDQTDVQFYDFMVKASLSKTVIFNWIFCNNCGLTPFRGSRIVCIDCRGESSVHRLHVTFDAADRKPHRPNHRMFKVHRYLFSRDVAKIEKAAKDALNSSREVMTRPKEAGDMPIRCLGCGTPVLLPCWCSVECKEKFICDNCEHQDLAFNGTHTKMHTIVRVHEEAERERSMEERMQLVEAELAKMRQTVAELTQTLIEKVGEQPIFM